MKRFSQWSPLTYRLAVEKNIVQRKAKDALSGTRFACKRQTEPLPHLIYAHNSLIRRTLGQVDPRLQDNKAVSLGLAAPCVDGILIAPGETFSFNQTVGQRTSARGYKSAPADASATGEVTLGGGISQVSSTLYYAALMSDLHISSRNNHYYVPSFIDYGLDATTSLQITNSTGYPIRIDAAYSGGYVKVAIFGTEERNYYLMLESSISSSTAPQGSGNAENRHNITNTSVTRFIGIPSKPLWYNLCAGRREYTLLHCLPFGAIMEQIREINCCLRHWCVGDPRNNNLPSYYLVLYQQNGEK